MIKFLYRKVSEVKEKILLDKKMTGRPLLFNKKKSLIKKLFPAFRSKEQFFGMVDY